MNLLEYWREFSLLIGGIITFFVGRKSTKIQERKNNADAVTAMQQTYDTFLQHYKEQYRQLLDNYTALQDQQKETDKRLNELEFRNSILLESSKEWESKYKLLKIDHDKLKKDFETYKKNHTK